MEEGKEVRNKVTEIFERLEHLNNIASEDMKSSIRIRDVLLGPPQEAMPEEKKDKPESVGILDRMIEKISTIHYKLLKMRDENLSVLGQIKFNK